MSHRPMKPRKLVVAFCWYHGKEMSIQQVKRNGCNQRYNKAVFGNCKYVMFYGPKPEDDDLPLDQIFFCPDAQPVVASEGGDCEKCNH